MYCVGLTGTIASGKSLALDYFHSKGIDTLSADSIAKSLTQSGTLPHKQLIQRFGPSFLLDNGELNRRKLREHIIAHPADKQWLEAYLHPLIRGALRKAIDAVKSAYCVIEIPLLLDKTPYPYLDRILLIKSEEGTQVKRLMARDNCSESEARKLLEMQQENDAREAIADDVVLNVGAIKAFHEELDKLHGHYLKKSLEKEH